MNIYDSDDQACRDLWAEVIRQAITDLQDETKDSERIIGQAQAWIFSERTDEGSFLWICAALNLDPEETKGLIAETYIQESQAV